MYIVGNAVRRAATQAKERLLERAAKKLGKAVDELDIKDKRIYFKAAPEKGILAAEVTKDAIYNYSDVEQITGSCSFKPSLGPPPYQAMFTEVEVDTETGAVEILKIVMASDCGVVINPEVVLGQCDGGIIQGVGFALYEDIIYDKNHEGIVLNPTMADYRVPTFPEFGDFTAIVHSDPADAPTTPLNVKGMGEASLVPVAPAIANAVYNAIGVRIKSGPLTPDKILEALGKV